MARKEINIFSASFLDLLSGALGAVIILYILVPKLNIPVEEFEEQKKLSEEVGKLGVAIEDIANLIPQEKLDAIKSQMEEVIAAKQALEQKIAGLQRSLEECMKSNEENVQKIISLQQELKEAHQQLDEANQKLAAATAQIEDLRPYKDWMDNCGFKPGDPCPETEALNVDVGFKFKGKNLLFIIDASGSMDTEGRMGQVQAGIKMLITTMSPDFNCDIMWFAEPSTGYYYDAKFGALQPMTDGNKTACFQFLNSLTPSGGTPTGIVLEHALGHSGYSNLTDIILLSDGIPSIPEGVTAGSILSKVRSINHGVAISTIGVGSHIISPDPAVPEQVEARKFLEQLARENNGFFYGF
ncbi:VWA domain-containing protein [bacterium]|nr:VWA domain-containing protein [bacterium]